MKPRDRRFWKRQTMWTRLPATIDSCRCDHGIGIAVTPEHCPGEDPPSAAIFLTPHEALGFASWLAEQAEHLIAKENRAAARRAARVRKAEGGTT